MRPWPQVVDFAGSGDVERLVRFELGGPLAAGLASDGLDASAVTLRLMRVELPGGEVEVLATSLLDTTRYPAAAALYGSLWRIEGGFKFLKGAAPVRSNLRPLGAGGGAELPHQAVTGQSDRARRLRYRPDASGRGRRARELQLHQRGNHKQALPAWLLHDLAVRAAMTTEQRCSDNEIVGD